MPTNARLSDTVRKSVMLRSGNRCEYCQSQDKFSPVYFTIDHITPILSGGDALGMENLAYSCSLCNRLKWQKTTALDLATNSVVRLYHPRTDIWHDHFQWSEDYLLIIGLTAIGRATVHALALNREKLVVYRQEMLEIGQHPPR